MFKKTIKFKNFMDQEVEKEFYFHLSKADLIRMAAGGSMEARLKRIIASNNNEEIFKEFEEIIRSAVGVRSEDGETFIKDAVAQSRLMDSPAYDELMVEIVTNPTAAVEFIQNLLPEKMQKELKAELDKVGQEKAPDPFADKEDSRPAYQKEHRDPTTEELRKMSHQEMVTAFAWREERNK